MHSSDTDAEALAAVIARTQQGETDAYALLIERFQRKIYLYCYYLLGSQEEAEDAAQEIFIKGFRSIGQYRPTAPFSSWLYKIAHHHCIDALKKRKRSLIAFLHIKNEPPPAAETVGRYADYIHELLEKLTPSERKVLLLRALEEYSFDEIGSVMGLTPAAVRKKYERLRKKLLGQKGGDPIGTIYGHAYKPRA
ncbi:RNA polymerase sigma factor [Paenibacillus rhizovicinus]|uniref:RNA polymerase sigma factor n=1 Tax=Paenibacillus rhizovicinus TaxID=2704463 RepID=A0A6C0NZG4_9BACL|nr:RNA polymerase sigma factor [Paenibacillus rhizovicinus]QHW31589.1 RNA polymerase sigma factor [Paenibacillus rhizovicinus]